MRSAARAQRSVGEKLKAAIPGNDRTPGGDGETAE